MDNEVARSTIDALIMEAINLKNAAEGIFNTTRRLKATEVYMDTLNDTEELAEYQERHDRAYCRIMAFADTLEEIKYG